MYDGQGVKKKKKKCVCVCAYGCLSVCLCVVCVCWHFYLLPVIRAELTDHVIGDKLVEGRPEGRGGGGEGEVNGCHL